MRYLCVVLVHVLVLKITVIWLSVWRKIIGTNEWSLTWQYKLFLNRVKVAGTLWRTLRETRSQTRVDDSLYRDAVCFHNPPNSDTDYRIFNVRSWSFNALVRTWGQGDPTANQQNFFDAKNTVIAQLCILYSRIPMRATCIDAYHEIRLT